jgi:hypothetical protein
VVPIVLFAYLSVQSRYFGRWLLPAYPALALLAASALAQAAELVRARPGFQAGVLAALTAVVLAQPLAADVRSGAALGRADTREQLRDWLVERFPPELRVAIEPAVPGRFYRINPDGRDPSWLGRCGRGSRWSYPGPGGKRLCARHRPGQFARPSGGVRASAYHVVVDAEIVDRYRRYGYCHVVTFGVVRERALATGDRDVRAYYDRLAREAEPVARFTPYDEGAEPVPFHFDLSFNLYPPEYHRPGPVTTVYRLKDCRQRYGPPAQRIPEAREIPPGTPQDEV